MRFIPANPLIHRDFLKATSWALVGLLLPGLLCANPHTAQTPNIVVILADDLGYGDVHAFNPSSKIPTPNLDSLAQRGMKFTDAHSGSAVCTPTRYGLLTGRYCWRTRLKQGVLNGYSSHLIDPDRQTMADMRKDPKETTNQVDRFPEDVKELTDILKKLTQSGRSRPNRL
jgi:arylsulfatase A